MARAVSNWPFVRVASLLTILSAVLIGWPPHGLAQEPKPKEAPPTAPPPPARDETLLRKMDALTRSPGFARGTWGLLVVDRKTGEILYERNADQLMIPASVTKLFTCAAALDALGPDHRFQTPVVRRGEVDANGVLKGDLILVASGDLALGGRTSPENGTLLFKDNDHTYAGGNLDAELVPVDPLAGLDHLAREILTSGIKEVTGDVIIDDRLFTPSVSTGSGPSRVTPIMVNDNLVDVLVSPAAETGKPASVKTIPASSYYTMDAQVETVPAGETAEVRVEAVGPRRFTVRGRIPVGHREVVKVYEVDEPAAFARALLIERLAARGVQLTKASPLGRNAAESLPPRDQVVACPKVAQYTSPPFKEYLRVILKVSHNLHASTLPLLISAKEGGQTLQQGLRRQGDYLSKQGIDLKSVSFGGGAGGSRSDLATPRAAVELLRAVDKRADAAAFESALPILGRDGTAAAHIANESPVRGHVRAKTGSYWVGNDLNGKSVMTSKALAGYMETAAGRPLVFAFFLNNVPEDGELVTSLAAGRLLGSLCEAVYLSDAPTPVESGDGTESQAEKADARSGM